MGTHAAVVYTNVTCGYLEVELYNKLAETFSYQSIDLSPLWELMNSADGDIKLTFEKVSTVVNFLDVSCSIKNDQLTFKIYHKPKHSFSYLHNHSCRPQYTKNNIVLLLGQIVNCALSENKEQHLHKLKSCLVQRGHLERGPRLYNDQAFLIIILNSK